MFNKKTEQFDDMVSKAKSPKDLNKIINMLENNIDNKFVEYFKQIREDRDISKSKLIKLSGLDKTYGYQILDGKRKPTRDKILQLCFGAKLNIEETNRVLKLGNVSVLYSKDPRDVILIYAISNNFSLQETEEKLHEMGFETLSKDV